MKDLKKIFIFSLVLCFVISFITLAENDNNFIPDNFTQAPEFAEKVDEGSLPPIEERLPEAEDLYIVEPVDSIGEYGGTVKSATIRPDWWGEDNCMMSVNTLLKYDFETGEYVPHLAKKVEVNQDKTNWTIHLRKGIRWSDGELFTADDIIFWYEDVLLNEELTPAISDQWKVDNEVMNMNKIDRYTVEISFSEPKPYFIDTLAHTPSTGMYLPKHYLKNYHPNYIGEEELERKAEKADFDHWYQLFSDKNVNTYALPFRKELPTLASYKIVERSSSRHVYERNPYYWKVDTAGNQLPYIERIETELVSDREVLNGKILDGSVDFAGFLTDIRNYPMYKKYEDEGNYRTILWEGGYGSEVIYMVNQTIENKNLREIFQNVKFRRALSLAIDRQEINEAIYFGRAEPRQYTVLESSQYFEPEYAKAYTEFKPEKAEAMLDDIGLVDINGDGWRQFSNGEKFTFTIEYYPSETPKSPNVELVIQHWKEIGLDVRSKQVSGELQGQRAPSNLMEATLWHGDKASDLLFPSSGGVTIIPKSPGWDRTVWPEWSRWIQSDGNSGEEPPEKVKTIHEWYIEAIREPDRDKRIELCKNILDSQAENLWVIGTVGEAPWPIVVDKDILNIPKEGIWAYDSLWTCSYDPEQFYFKNGENVE